MEIAELKDRIEPVSAERLASHGHASDAVRAWVRSVGINGPVVLVDTLPGRDIEAGIRCADTIVDEGGAAVVVHLNEPLSDISRAVVGLLCSVDATRVTPGADTDLAWMQQCARIRDLQTTCRSRLADAIDIVDPEVAGMAAFLIALAARRTPVVLVGAFAHAAAVVAQRQSLTAADWWRSGIAHRDPLIAAANERLRYDPWWLGIADVESEVINALMIGTLESASS